MKNSKEIIIVLAVIFCTTNALAITINSPMTYDDPNIVGTIDGETYPANVSSIKPLAQTLLNLAGTGYTTTIDGFTYTLSNVNDFEGTLTNYLESGANPTGDQLTITGWEWVLGKYDGPNAGYVLFYAGGDSITIPLLSTDFWSNPAGKGYAISHWVAFNGHPVPEPTTMLLFGTGLIGVAGLTRRKNI